MPTGSAVSDFYGADRVGDDLFADTLVALDVRTGKMLWHFQGVHHDIWDRDFPSPPALVTVRREGKMVDAVAQTTKQGFVFVFDRVSGRPLFPIEERPFPASTVLGEVASRTQPVPLIPLPFARQRLTAEMLTTRTAEAHAWAVEQFKAFRSDGLFVPLSLDKQTVVFPGFDGGGEWGGPAVDPRSGVIYINSNDLPWTGSLTANKRGGARRGHLSGPMCRLPRCRPSWRSARLSVVGRGPDQSFTDQIREIVHKGKGRMLGFPNLRDAQLEQLLDFLDDPTVVLSGLTKGARRGLAGNAPPADARYHFTGYRKFLDPDGYPAVVPPWGPSMQST